MITGQAIRHSPSQAQVNDNVLKDLHVPLEAGGEDEVSAIGGDHRKGARCLDVHLLEAVKKFHVVIPQVDLREGVVTPKGQVVAFFEGERLENHGASGGQGLDLYKLFGTPTYNLRVANVARHRQVELLLDAEVLYSYNVLHVGDLTLQGKLLAAPAPLVDHRHLRAACQDKVGLPIQVQELCICVTVPLMQRLVRIEALIVPLIEGGQARFGAVCDHKEPIRTDLKCLDVIGLRDCGHLNVLELAEPALVLIKLVDVRTIKELSHDDKHLVLDDHRLAPHDGLTWTVQGNENRQMSSELSQSTQRPKCSRTCDVIISPEVHFYVVPLENHTAVCAGSSNSHVDIVLEAECVDGQRLRRYRLMQDEICRKAQFQSMNVFCKQSCGTTRVLYIW